MALIPPFVRRPSAILRIPDAIARGLSPTAFIQELKGMGLSYRKTLMLSDWRTVAGVEAKKDLIRFVRKDRLPSPAVMADKTWEYSKEYIYKVNTWSRLKPEEPLTERMVTLLSDTPLTTREVEEQIAEKWAGYERYGKERLERALTSAVYHRIEGPLAED